MRMLGVNAMCKEVMDGPEVAEDRPLVEGLISNDNKDGELNDPNDAAKEYSLSCRLKVFFVGDGNCGKSSVIQSLVGDSSRTTDGRTEGVCHVSWHPLKDPANEELLKRTPSFDESNLTVELWDLSGRKVCQGVHQMFLTEALYVIVFNLADPASYQRLPGYVKDIQNKVPGCPILLVATRADKLFTEEDRKKKATQVMKSLQAAEEQETGDIKQQITNLSNLGADRKLLSQIDWLESLLQRRPRLPDIIHIVSCKTGKGLVDFKQRLLNMALDCDVFPHTWPSTTPEVVCLTERLSQQRMAGKLLLTWEEYVKLSTEETVSTEHVNSEKDSDSQNPPGGLADETSLLRKQGIICDFLIPRTGTPDQESVHYVCITPPALAHAICMCHVDNPRKAFRIEARRFWPSQLGNQKPDPGVLVKMLEEIPNHGVIREVLLPILWQDLRLQEEQVQRMIYLLISVGVLWVQPRGGVPPPTTLTPPSLILPTFPNLSSDTSFHAIFMNLAPDKRPQLNWTPKPFKGDIQVNWKYTFPHGTPPGLSERILTACRVASTTTCYTYQWRHGILVKMEEAIVCVQLDLGGSHSVDVSCRVNADDPGEERESVELLWVYLAPFVLVTNDYLRQWPGLFYRIELVPYGQCLFYGDTVNGDHAFQLAECFIAAKNDHHISFTDAGVERILDISLLMRFDPMEKHSFEDWLSHMVSRREEVIRERSSTPLSPPPRRSTTTRSLSTESPPTKPLKKKLEIKWSLSGDDLLKNKPTITNKDNHTTLTKRGSTDRSNSLDNGQEKGVDDKEPTAITGALMSEAEQTKEATRLASGFVAAILAQAVADYIEFVYEDNHGTLSEPAVTKAQVEAARVTAKAALAVQTGETEASARAVLTAAKSIQQAIDNQHILSSNARSKTCHIL